MNARQKEFNKNHSQRSAHSDMHRISNNYNDEQKWVEPPEHRQWIRC